MSSDPVQPGLRTLLVVEDDPAMLIALRDILEGAGFRVCTADNGEAALEVFASERPALVLSDISMPVMDGIGLFESVRKLPGGTMTPFVFLTARGTREDIFAGRSLGADDYITKPITSQELISAVRARLSRADEMMVAQLRTAYKDSLRVLANAIEARDHLTRDHVERVSAYAQAMGREMGWGSQKLEALEFGAILHDIGKIAVREATLTKAGPLSPEEWEEMRQHPEVGARMVQGIPYLAHAVPIVLHHHERWDGSGYPHGLKAEEIPEEARLMAVVDVFDAMTSDRPYHPAYSPEHAREEILSLSGQQFDARMVQAFAACWDRGDLALYL
ncbi:MAG TPA: HD domain-containing phosphohydrolase [Anaerolineales bacterium]|nr:HD domain-containing phosphohydrolase [Anaerolineales bacterium]